MANPTVSVIVPAYNAENFIESCVESILRQTYTDFELILVNDGSKDSTSAICHRLAAQDSRITVIDQENGGSSSAKNTGLGIARGSYIEFIDADDTLDEAYMEQLLRGTAEDEADLCVGNVAFVDMKAGKQVLSRPSPKLHEGMFTLKEYLSHYKDYMPHAIVGAPWNKLFRRSIIEEHHLRFDETTRNNEDTWFNLAYLRHCGKVFVSASPFYHYINHQSGSASRRYIDDIIDIYIETYRRSTAFLKETEMYDCNEQFCKSYFIGLCIGALNGIVLQATQYTQKEKLQKMRDIIERPEVRDALKDLQEPDKKKRMIAFLMRHRWVRLLYSAFRLKEKL